MLEIMAEVVIFWGLVSLVILIIIKLTMFFVELWENNET